MKIAAVYYHLLYPSQGVNDTFPVYNNKVIIIADGSHSVFKKIRANNITQYAAHIRLFARKLRTKMLPLLTRKSTSVRRSKMLPLFARKGTPVQMVTSIPAKQFVYRGFCRTIQIRTRMSHRKIFRDPFGNGSTRHVR